MPALLYFIHFLFECGDDEQAGRLPYILNCIFSNPSLDENFVGWSCSLSTLCATYNLASFVTSEARAAGKARSREHVGKRDRSKGKDRVDWGMGRNLGNWIEHLLRYEDELAVFIY